MASITPHASDTSTSLGWPQAATRPPRRYVSGPLIIDRLAREVSLAGSRVVLTLKEYALLCHFFAHAGEVLSREELVRDVWNGSPGSRRRIDICVRRIRAKLAGLPELETRRGMGYVLRAVVPPAPAQPSPTSAFGDAAGAFASDS